MSISNGINDSILPESQLDVFSADALDEITVDLYNLWRDSQFSIGFKKMLEAKVKNTNQTFFIGDIGSPHCLSVALAMMSEKISCNFVFKKKVSPRVRDVMLLIGDELIKRNPQTEKGSIATLIDCHRDEPWKTKDNKYEVLPNEFPKTEELKNRGIAQVCLLLEMETGRDFYNFDYPSDINQVLNLYRANGIEVIAVGIDEVWAYNEAHGTESDRNLFANAISTQNLFRYALIDLIENGDPQEICDLLAGKGIPQINP